MQTFDTGNNSVLGIKRTVDGHTLTAVFNFSEHWQHTELTAVGLHNNLITGEIIDLIGQWELTPYAFVWLLG